MRTAEAVLIEVMNIQDRVGDGKTHINDVVNAVRAYGEEVKEACAKAIEDELAAVNQIPFAEKCRSLPLP